MLSLFQGLLTGLEEDDKIKEFRVVPEKPSIPQEAPVAAFPNPDNFKLTPPVPQPAGYFDGITPQVPKDIYAPQSPLDFIESSGAIASINNPNPLVAPEVEVPMMRPAVPLLPLTDKEIVANKKYDRQQARNANDIGELNPFRASNFEGKQELRWKEEASGKVPLQSTPYSPQLQDRNPLLEREIPSSVPEVAKEVPNVVAKEVPNVVAKEVPNVAAREVPEVAKEVPKPTPKDNNISAVTAQDAADSAEVIDPEVKTVLDDEIDVVLGNEGFARLMPGEDAGGDLVAEDLDGNITTPDKGFFKKLFDGVGGFLSEQMEDPAVRKTIFAYVASRIAGYDGVTLAAGVLENEWKKKSALLLREQGLEDKAAARAIVVADRDFDREQTVSDRDLKREQDVADRDEERAFALDQLVIEKNAEALKGLQPDLSKVSTMYNPETRTNQTGSLSVDGTRFYPSNGSNPQSVQSLLSQGFKRGKGQTVKDQRQSLLDLSKTTVSNIRTGIVDQLNASEMKGADKESIIKSINNATNPNVIRQAVGGFTSRFGPSVDYENMDVTNMFERGLGNYMQAVQEGRATGSKDLEGYLDFELVKFDITKGKGIPSEYWEITNNPNQEIGLNTWSPANNKVKRMLKDINNSKGKKVGSPEVYKQLQLIFKAKSNLSQTDKGNPFLSYWQGVSKTSANDPALAASPFVHFINSIGNPDIDSQYAPQNIKGVTSQILKKLNK